MSQVTKKDHKSFEDIRQKTKEGGDFWSARDLQRVLDYKSWDKFKAVIQKAIKSCENSKNDPFNHFSRSGKMVKIGSGAERHIPDYDYWLSRYACYLIVQNGDSSKPVIASYLNIPRYVDTFEEEEEIEDLKKELTVARGEM